MSKTATIALSLQESGDQSSIGGPTSIGPYTQANSPGKFTKVTPQIGQNWLVFPQGFTFQQLWIDPNAANSGAALTLKGLPADTGVPLSVTNPSLIPLATTDWRTGGPVTQCVIASTVGGVPLAIGWV